MSAGLTNLLVPLLLLTQQYCATEKDQMRSSAKE